MMVRMRRFVVSDRASLEETINAVCREGRWMSTSSFQPTGAWRHALEEPDCLSHCLLVVEDKGRVVGWCRVLPIACRTKATKAELGIGLLPDYRNQGLGTVLVERALVWAKGLPLEHVWLRTREDNARARRVFSRCGFRPCSMSNGWVRMVCQLEGVLNEMRTPFKLSSSLHGAGLKMTEITDNHWVLIRHPLPALEDHL